MSMFYCILLYFISGFILLLCDPIFNKVNIRVGHVEDNPEKVVRYINRLRFEIQDEMSLLSPNFVEEAYQFP